jgi:hypothetical protein
MDAVSLHVFSAQEEEFAIAAMCRQSPYWGLTFPRRVAKHDRYIFVGQLPDGELKTWRRNYLLFLRKLTFWSRKRPLLKSPYNTARVATLREMFPNAKFIHIYRHPYAVYPSNIHAAREGFVMFQVQDPDPRDSFETRFLDKYRALEEAFYRDAKKLPAGDIAEVRFEDLERDPIAEIHRVYSELGLELHPRLRRRLERYLESIADYKKNRLKELSESQRREIDAVMGSLMEQWGYASSDQPPRTHPARAA